MVHTQGCSPMHQLTLGVCTIHSFMTTQPTYNAFQLLRRWRSTSTVHCHRFQLNSTNFVADSPTLSPTQPAPPPASPCLVTGPSLAAQAPPGQSSASADHLHESELPQTAGDSAVNGVLVNRGMSRQTMFLLWSVDNAPPSTSSLSQRTAGMSSSKASVLVSSAIS